LLQQKKGVKGEISYSFDSSVGFRDINYRPLMADTNSFVTYSNEAILLNLLTDSNPNNDNSLSYFFPSNQSYNTNWLNEVTQPGKITNHNISASGGNDDIRSFFSFGLNQEKKDQKEKELNLIKLQP